MKSHTKEFAVRTVTMIAVFAGAIIFRPAPAAAEEVLIDPSDAVILLLDHQTGLFQTVKDIDIRELRTNTTTLAKLATMTDVPVIYTASEPNGPNGPLMPEIEQNAPDAVYVPRKGEISSWDNEDFVKAVEETGRKTLIIAGVWTSVCVAFPALQAKEAGYKVYFVPDASGDPSPMTSQTTLFRLTQAGVIPISTNAVVCEFQRTWNRPDAAEFAALFKEFNPHYGAAIESFERANSVGAQSAQ